MKQKSPINVEYIKNLGKEKSLEAFDLLLNLHKSKNNFTGDVKREIVSSIGRFKDKSKVFDFVSQHVFDPDNSMDEVYQYYRTVIYNDNLEPFLKLKPRILKYFDNEVLYNMEKYHNYRKKRTKSAENKFITSPLILEGDNIKKISELPEKSIQLMFTSPPYFNARYYSVYKSYKEYLDKMLESLIQCYRVLEDGRFIIYNVSPVITKRPGREFSSHRYPIHFDFHNLFVKAGFTFIDEIIWIKPEASVTNRNGGIQQTRTPLMYKPNTITESILVYRKDVGFLLDKNIQSQKKISKIPDNFSLDTSNCWYIQPSSNPLHPAVFPEKLCEKILMYYSFEGDVVLDHFAGSGTFGKVALRNNRIPILCEQNKQYIDKLKKDFQLIPLKI